MFGWFKSKEKPLEAMRETEEQRKEQGENLRLSREKYDKERCERLEQLAALDRRGDLIKANDRVWYDGNEYAICDANRRSDREAYLTLFLANGQPQSTCRNASSSVVVKLL